MADVYFDSSALVKLCVDEPGSAEAAALWDAADTMFASPLAHVEVCAALGAAGRNHQLTDTQVTDAIGTWETIWDTMRPIELTEHVYRLAAQLALVGQLRGADAVYLASAQVLGMPHLVFATWDKRLHAAAARSGLRLAPASFD